jgi:tRNA(Ile)-lysidine synthase
VPALEAVHPAAVENVARTAALLREEAAVLDGLVAEVLAAELTRERLAALPAALGRLVLRRLCEDAVGGLVPRAASRLEDVLALGDDGALDVGDGARVEVRRGVVAARRTPAR